MGAVPPMMAGNSTVMAHQFFGKKKRCWVFFLGGGSWNGLKAFPFISQGKDDLRYKSFELQA